MSRPLYPWALTEFEQAVHRIVQGVPPGHVVTYGDVAFALGRPGAARAVGQVMRCNPDTNVTPCHRVVSADGTVGGYNGRPGPVPKKIERLRAEGIKVEQDGKITHFDMVRWRPAE